MTNVKMAQGRIQSPGEEIANAISHGVAFLLTLAAVPLLLITAVRHGDAAWIVGASIFAATTLLLYLVSTIYHALPRTRAKRVFQIMDHAAIFLLIAGTYTPFTLGALRGGWGWTIFGIVWGLCLAGVMLKLLRGTRHPRLSMTLYLMMGWLALIAVQPLTSAVSTGGLLWLLAGGVAYTGGVFFFVAEQRRYSHFIWHLFTIVGTACHFMAILLFSA